MSPEVPVLRDLALLAGASFAVALLFQRLRLPAILGFIVAGVLIGPGGFGLVSDEAFVRLLAQLGVIVLLFTVGLEFSLADLRRLGPRALLAGALQVALTLGTVAGLLVAAGVHPARAVFLGMLAALSSTAVVLRLLTDRIELQAPHGRLATGVLIFQDLAAIPILMSIPALARWSRGVAVPLRPALDDLLVLLFTVAVVVLVFLAARRAIPWLVGRASRSGSREVFLFGVLLVLFGSASLASRAGGSLAVGAFLAGLLLAGSELKTFIASNLLPFRDALSSIFFVAIGMSFAPRAAFAHPGWVLAGTVGLVGVKLVTGLLALGIAGVPRRVAVATTLALAQIGEFSFVVAGAGMALGLMDAAVSQAFYAGAVFSLAVTPLLVAAAPRLALALDVRLPRVRGALLPGPAPAADSSASEPARSPLLSDHVVIAGCGLNGHNVARVLRSVRLPHLVVDMNPDALQDVVRDGSRVLVGDITHPDIQRHAGMPRARVLVLALSDPAATRHACRVARSLSHELFIVVRTRYVAEIDQLYAAGANQVIPEEFETSIEIFTAVLRDFHVPNNVIQAQILLLRQERYSLLRGRKLPPAVVEQLEAILTSGTTDTFLLLQESPAVGRTLGELGLLGATGARVVAVVRGGRALAPLEESLALRVGDTLVLAGTHAEMERAFAPLQRERAPV